MKPSLNSLSKDLQSQATMMDALSARIEKMMSECKTERDELKGQIQELWAKLVLIEIGEQEEVSG